MKRDKIIIVKSKRGTSVVEVVGANMQVEVVEK